MPSRPDPDETTPSPNPSPTTSSPTKVAVPLPAFSSRRQKVDPLPEGTTVEPPGVLDGVSVAELGEPAAPNGRSSDAPRTTSSAGEQPEKADPKVIAGAVAGLIGIVATLAAAVLLRSPRPRLLREPLDDERDAIAAPVARIIARHAPTAAVGPDFMDAIATAAAVGNYVTAGPLTYPANTAGDMPAEDPEEN